MIASPRGPDIDPELAAALKKCDANTPLERKEGLSRLQTMFTDRRMFQPHEMRKITECFNRLFVDTNAKVKILNAFKILQHFYLCSTILY